jgi:hypothetical protein
MGECSSGFRNRSGIQIQNGHAYTNNKHGRKCGRELISVFHWTIAFQFAIARINRRLFDNVATMWDRLRNGRGKNEGADVDFNNRNIGDDRKCGK